MCLTSELEIGCMIPCCREGREGGEAQLAPEEEEEKEGKKTNKQIGLKRTEEQMRAREMRVVYHSASYKLL